MARRRVSSRNLVNEEVLPHWGAVVPYKKNTFYNTSTSFFKTKCPQHSWNCNICACVRTRARRVAQSVYRLTTRWTVRDRIPAWMRFSAPLQTDPGAHPASCKMDTGSFPGVKCGRGVLLTTHPLLVPRSWKSRVIPLPTLWATPRL